MKQKIAVKVEMNCQKCRTKALEIAASINGVDEVKLEGEEKDRVVVIGEGVDSIRLIKSFRKKVGQAHILTLDEVKPANSQKQKQQQQSSSSNDNPTYYYADQAYFHYHHPKSLVGYNLVYDPMPSNNCCIM